MSPLEPNIYHGIIRDALREDVGASDETTAATVDSSLAGRGILLAKAPCVIAGLAVALEVFRAIDANVVTCVVRGDGDVCGPGDVVAEVTGPAHVLLTAERTALNLLQRLSGVATVTRRFVEASGGRITVLDTRKTTPLLRALEKYAVRVGGGTNHRFGLFDAYLIKDNHVRLAGGVASAVSRARRQRPDWPIEVEVQTLVQVDEALGAGADIVLLDNMSTADITAAVARCRGRAKIEISGGVTLARIPELAATGADFVSVGALTHSAPAVDISFEIEPA